MTSFHCNIIYNHALSETPDTKLSLKFTEHLAKECDRHGLNCYYHERDALPGKIMFVEFAEVVETSKFTILILTSGFVEDCYSTYRKYTALKMLIDDKRIDKIIPVVIGEVKVPKDIGFFTPVKFSADPAIWDTDESKQSWRKLLMRLTDQDVIYSRISEPVKESGDNQQRTEIYNTFVTETTPSLVGSASEVSVGSRHMVVPPATKQYSQEVESNQQVSDPMSLVQRPTIQTPDLNPSRTAGLSASNENAAPPVALNDFSGVQRGSAGRQNSLSQDPDLSMDLGPSQSHLCSPDSGYSPDNSASTSTDAAGSQEDSTEITLSNTNDQSIPNEDSCTQGTVGNNIMNVNNSNGANTDVTNITKSKTTMTESWNESLSSQANQETPHQSQDQEWASYTVTTKRDEIEEYEQVKAEIEASSKDESILRTVFEKLLFYNG